MMPKNVEVERVNDKIAEAFPGEAWTCKSADMVDKTEDTFAAPSEFLNELQPAGIPKHCLELKRNMPVMLMRNLSPVDGLCNGTRLLVKRVISGRLLEAEIATGEHSGMRLAARGTTAGHALHMTCDVLTQLARRTGETVYIPRIKLSPDDDNLPFAWSRRQFPVKIAFAMTSASPP